MDCMQSFVNASVLYTSYGVHNLFFSRVSWPSGLAYRTQVLVLATECGFESRPWHLCPWARHLTIIASLHPGVKWVPVRAELVDYHRPYMRCNGSNWAVYSPGSWDGFRNDVWALWAGVIMRLEHHLVGGYVRYISPYIIIITTEWFNTSDLCLGTIYLFTKLVEANSVGGGVQNPPSFPHACSPFIPHYPHYPPPQCTKPQLKPATLIIFAQQTIMTFFDKFLYPTCYKFSPLPFDFWILCCLGPWLDSLKNKH